MVANHNSSKGKAMRHLTGTRVFAACFLLAMTFVLGAAAYGKWQRGQALQVYRLTPAIAVSEQLSVANLRYLKREGFATIVDLRPDGEAPDQPSSTVVEHAARDEGLRFFYVPVPHGDIPDAAVARLRVALAASDGQVLLYCRSGRRAARTWGLVEASRPGGLDAGAILAAVRQAGQSADDLETALRQRIAQRARTGEQP
jgi:uncharacterized protein (TIGR01244 family)